ncbi:MAG: DUF3488 domain-containing protein [Thermoguttaceae bacterium]|nr:DUF3488 domain-containing protein [Thermoguttaceae bacterium]
MNFAISSVLAVAAILASFMLQLGGEDASGAFVAAFSFFGILGALCFVDGKRLFALPKSWTNVLIVAVVLAHLGPLARSRQEFLAFSIANILAVVQTFLFFQEKTRRIYYQILTISFVEVAVGCVFQRSGLFAILTPLYALSLFCAVSLLTLEGERAYYAANATLRPRFVRRSRRSKERARSTPVSLAPSTPSSSALLLEAFAERNRPSDALFVCRRHPAESTEIDAEFFRRFVVSSLGAFGAALVLFCLFPRFHRLEIGDVQFGRENWNAGGPAIRSTVGFSEKIELGELGPSGDNRQRTLTVRFFDVLEPERKNPVAPNSPIYLRGIPTANYSDRVWSQVDWESPRLDLASLTAAIRRTSPTDPSELLSPLASELKKIDERPKRRLNASRNRSQFSPPSQAPAHWNDLPPLPPPGGTLADVASTPLYRPKGDWLPYFDQGTAIGDLKSPTFLYENLFLRTTNPVDQLIDFADLKTVLPDRRKVRRNFPSPRLFDARTRLLGLEIEMEPLDTGVVFAPWPFYFTRQDFYFAGNVPRRTGRAAGRSSKFRFATNAFFADGKQTELTPNQESVWPFLDQYLALDAERFPELVATARRWDAESGLPKEDFAGRALYITSRLRDVGEYQYDRSGVARTPGLDPLEDFVSVNKRGHCEYFAGALALMLRAVGIPSRTVVGFLVFSNEKGGATVVRQSDAHAWTEAFIPPQNFSDATSPAARLFEGAFDDSPNNFPVDSSWTADGGWLRLDATPPSPPTSNALIDGAALSLEFFSRIWRDYVLNFNGARQADAFYRPLAALAKDAFDAVRSFGENGFRPFASTFERLKDALDRASSGDWSAETLGSLLSSAARLALAAFVVWRLVVFYRRRRRAKRSESGEIRRKTRRRRRELAFYYRLERALANRLATERRLDETPLEFLERCFALEDEFAAIAVETPRSAPQKSTTPFEPTPDATRRLFRELVERYYRARFAGTALSADEAARWNAALRAAKIGRSTRRPLNAEASGGRASFKRDDDR